MRSRTEQNLTFLSHLKKIPLSAADVDCIFSTKAFKTELLTQIAKAQERIYLAALYLESDDAGKEILMALYDAKQRNPQLDIAICIDFHRAQRGLIGKSKEKNTNATWYQEVEQAQALGIKIMGVPVKRKELFGVQHLKGFIFDNRVLYSGASLNDIYLHQAQKYRLDRYWSIDNRELANSMVTFLKEELVNRPAVMPLNAAHIPKISTFKVKQRQLVKSLKQSSYKFSGEIASDELSVVPLNGLGARQNTLNRNIRRLLQSTQREIVIFTPYFNLPRIIGRDINALLKRGVKLTLVVGDKTANDFYIPTDKPFKTIGGLPYLYESNLKKFAEKYKSLLKTDQLNLHLWKDQNNSFHLKGLYADNRFMLLTGHNLNPRAWRLDLENGLLIDDPKQELKCLADQELAHILTNTTMVSDPRQIESIDDYPPRARKLLMRLRRIRADKLVKSLL